MPRLRRARTCSIMHNMNSPRPDPYTNLSEDAPAVVKGPSDAFRERIKETQRLRALGKDPYADAPTPTPVIKEVPVPDDRARLQSWAIQSIMKRSTLQSRLDSPSTQARKDHPRWQNYLQLLREGAHNPLPLFIRHEYQPEILEDVLPTLPLPILDRFMKMIDVAPPKAYGECWLFMPPGMRSNAPNFGVRGGRTVTAASFAYSIWSGPLYEGDHVRHKCLTGSGCVFPAHLFVTLS